MRVDGMGGQRKSHCPEDRLTAAGNPDTLPRKSWPLKIRSRRGTCPIQSPLDGPRLYGGLPCRRRFNDDFHCRPAESSQAESAGVPSQEEACHISETGLSAHLDICIVFDNDPSRLRRPRAPRNNRHPQRARNSCLRDRAWPKKSANPLRPTLKHTIHRGRLRSREQAAGLQTYPRRLRPKLILGAHLIEELIG